MICEHKIIICNQRSYITLDIAYDIAYDIVYNIYDIVYDIA
jgi:hypothetical protein